jgi:adenine-specific DNA-methyltransferase
MPTLRWLTRDDDIRAAGSVPYRLLEEVPELGYGDRDTGNMLIQGDNLDALKALLPFYAGQVKRYVALLMSYLCQHHCRGRVQSSFN